MKKGLYLFFVIIFLFINDLFSNETDFFKFKYLRMGNGLCSKCNITLKKINNIEDKYKPIIIINSNESKYIKDILDFNGLLLYPKDKIVVNDSLTKILLFKDYPILYYSNQNDIFSKLVLDQNTNLDAIKLILGSYKVTKRIFDSSFYLPPFTEYYFEKNTILFCNDYAKTITFFDSKKNKTIVKLTNLLKRKIFQKISKDSDEFNLLVGKGNKAIQFGADNSFFGSICLYKDTLYVLSYISIINKVKNKLRSSQIQVLVKIFNNEIFDCFYIEYNPKNQIIYDESGEHSMIYKNDSLFLIATHYNLFNKLKKKNHLSLFVKINNKFILKKNYSLEIPNILLESSNDTIDRTSGQFFDFENLNYFYILSPNIFLENKNLEFKSNLFSIHQNLRYNAKNISFYSKNNHLTSLISINNTDKTYIRYGTVDNEILLPIKLEGFNYNAKISENSIVYISNDGYYIEKIILPAN